MFAITTWGHIGSLERVIDHPQIIQQRTLRKIRVSFTKEYSFSQSESVSSSNEKSYNDLVSRKATKENYLKPYRNRTLVGWCEYTKVDGITMLKELCKTAVVTSG